ASVTSPCMTVTASSTSANSTCSTRRATEAVSFRQACVTRASRPCQVHSVPEGGLTVNRKGTPPIPEAIVQLPRQLDQFRSTQPRRTKLPESLWQAAVALARQHGVYCVAHPLPRD